MEGARFLAFGWGEPRICPLKTEQPDTTMFKKMMLRTLAAAGGGKAQGELDRLETKEKLRSEWDRGRGAFGWKPTYRDVAEFVQRYGVDISDLGIAPGATFSKEQLDSFFDTLAGMLLASGAVSFNPR